MLRTRYASGACGRLAIVAAMVLAILVAPSGASANAEHRSTVEPVAFGSGYAQPHGSPRVRWVQRRLVALGYAPGPVDGRFGPLTAAAVRRFQATRRLAADADVGPITAAELRRAAPVTRLGAGYDRRHGLRTVRSIQRRLRQLHYSPGPLDGRFGPLTERAVERFQSDHGLDVDGEVGPETRVRLRPHAAAEPPAAVIDTGKPDRVPAIAAIPTLEQPASLPPHAALPHRGLFDALLIGIAVLGAGAFAAGYVHTRSQIARARRTPIGNQEQVR